MKESLDWLWTSLRFYSRIYFHRIKQLCWFSKDIKIHLQSLSIFTCFYPKTPPKTKPLKTDIFWSRSVHFTPEAKPFVTCKAVERCTVLQGSGHNMMFHEVWDSLSIKWVTRIVVSPSCFLGKSWRTSEEPFMTWRWLGSR